jgi:hypothetical protein
MSIFTETSIITLLKDADIVKGMDINSSNPEQKVMIVGKNKYLHSLYTVVSKNLFSDVQPNAQKIFTVYEKNNNILLCLMDEQMDCLFYLITIRSTKRKTYNDIKTSYSVDTVDIVVNTKVPKELSEYNLKAYGTWEFGANTDFILLGTHMTDFNLAESKYEHEYFKFRYFVSHVQYHYGTMDILGTPRVCTFDTK